MIVLLNGIEEAIPTCAAASRSAIFRFQREKDVLMQRHGSQMSYLSVQGSPVLY